MAVGDPQRPDADRTVGQMVFEVSERTSVLIREEIELAKTEVTEKLSTLARGSVVGIVAGVFAFLALILLMHGVALGIASLLGWSAWAGYMIEAALFLAVAAGAGWFAWRSFDRTGAPVPTGAIDEAQKTKALLTAGDGGRDG